MCLGRSYNSIFQVQEEYSYPMVIGAVANPLLPDKVRSAFTQLLTHVYIDSFPHAAVRAPYPPSLMVLAAAVWPSPLRPLRPPAGL